MPPKSPKQPAKRGLLPKLKSFLDALSDRYQQALQVIDEALASESLKDKIWAVDLILKRTPAPENSQTSAKAAEKPMTAADLSQLGDADLLNKIRSHLKDWEP
jgi:hypothetical protein